jgi:hypothetical protein
VYSANFQSYYINLTHLIASAIHAIINDDADLKKFHKGFSMNLDFFLLSTLLIGKKMMCEARGTGSSLHISDLEFMAKAILVHASTGPSLQLECNTQSNSALLTPGLQNHWDLLNCGDCRFSHAIV